MSTATYEQEPWEYDEADTTYDGYDTTPATAFPQARLPFRCEVAFGISPDVAFIDPIAWSNVTPYFLDQTVTINRGRANETDETQLMSIGFELDNEDGVFTPDNAESILYPFVRRGVLCRYGIYGGQSYLQNPTVTVGTNYYSTPDQSQLDVVTDIDIAFEIQPYGMPSTTCLMSKWTSAGNQRSWQVFLTPDADHLGTFAVTLQWSTNGTLAAAQAVTTNHTFSYENKQNIRVTMDVDDGLGQRVIKFYTATKWGEEWKLFYTATLAGTTAIFNSTAPLVVGSDPEYGFYPFIGKMFRAQVKRGIDGPLVADADFTGQPPGNDSFFDSTGLVWSAVGNAVIDNLHTRFFGQVDSWELTWPYGDTTGRVAPESRVQVQASSIRRKLGQGDQPIQSALRRQLSALPVATVAYWPMEDEAESTVAASGLSNGIAASVSGFNFASDSDEPGTAPLPTLESLAAFNVTVPSYVSTNFFTIGMMTKITAVPAIDQTLMRVIMPGATGYQVVFGLNLTNAFIKVYNSAGTLVGISGAMPHASAFLNKWGTWFMAVVKNGTGVDYFIAFRQAGVVLSSFAFGINLPATTMANAGTLSSEFGSQLVGMTIGHVSVILEAVGDAYIGADDGWAGEDAVDRFRRLCDEQVIYEGAGETPTNSTALGPQVIDTILSLLYETAFSANSIFLDARFFNGLQYIPLYDLLNQSVQLALDAAEEHITNPISPTLDDQFIRNQVESSRPGGSSAVRQDDTSVDEEGLYPTQVTVNVETDAQLPDDANWRLHLGTAKGMTYPPITIELAKAPELIPVWLDEYTDVGCVVTLINLPRQADPTPKRFILQGYVETITPIKWTLVLNCTPYQPYEVTEFNSEFAVLRLDSSTSTLDAGINSAVTALTVNLNGGSSWTTDPTDWPFPITLAGEEMMVTAVAAVVGGKQVFTVTRSVNSVTKSHVAGEKVRLMFPVALSLV